MRKIFSLFIAVLFLTQTVNSQELLSATLLGTRTKTQLISQFSLPLIQYGARMYRIEYTTTDLAGNPDTVSGLVTVPVSTTQIFPRLVYQHGTAGSTNDVPSFNAVSGGEGIIALLFAGMGYVTLAPDYLGLGVSDGFHPYVHAATEASVALDMLSAVGTNNVTFGAVTNDQLFITGYSQGGHGAMALQKVIETDTASALSVTASAPLSGPYSLSEVMRGLILSDSIYYFPAYIPYTFLSFQTVYGNLFTDLSEAVRPPYQALIQQFWNGQISLNTLNTQLINLLTVNEGAVRPSRIIQPAFIQAVSNNLQHPVNIALRANDTYTFTAKTPTRLYYCKADDQVPYQNSLLARDSMIVRGANNLQAIDVDSNADHGGCVTPALTQTLFFFAGFQNIGTVSTSDPDPLDAITLFPNPSSTHVVLDHLPTDGTISLFDASGRMVKTVSEVPSGKYILQLEGIEKGPYLLLYESGSKSKLKKLIVR